MDEKGVYAVARSLWDCDAFMNQRFTQREAWLWLIGAAVWRQTSLNLDGKRVTLERGEFCFAVRFLAVKWKWSKSAVSRFIVLLEKRDMIRDTSRDRCAVFSINKYNEFQVVGLPKRDTERDTERDLSGTDVGHARDKEETLKHLSIEVSKKAEAPAVAVAPASKPLRGTRWPAEAVVPDDWIAEAAQARSQDGSPAIDLEYEAKRFENYWAAKAGGAAALKLDWRRTWLNWATDKGKTGNGRTSNTKQTAVDQHLAGIAEVIRERRA